MKGVGCAFLLGIGSCFALLWVYAWCMVDTRLPDAEARRIAMMFRMSDQGLMTVPALMALFGSVSYLLISFILCLRRVFGRKP